MNLPDEGYIKFQADWVKANPLHWEALLALDRCRDILYKSGLIGAYPDGIGFGNVSCRRGDGDQFIITGSATGNLPRLDPSHYTLVTSVDIDRNTLQCNGPILASSESMSHAVIYRECPEVQGVIHIHHLELWEKLLHRVPTTEASATYGSPEMAYSIIDLLRTTDLEESRLFVMEGHREGIFAFGHSLEEATDVVMNAFCFDQ